MINIRLISTALLPVLFLSCASFKVVQKTIPFPQERIDLSLQYLSNRHDLDQEHPTITPKMVVVHWTAIPTLEASFQVFESSHLPGSRKGIAAASALNVSAHYLIDRDGTVFQLLPDTLFARHTIGLNHCAIGIENVGDGKNHPLTNMQMRSNTRLIRQLLQKYRIKYVIGHHEYRAFEEHPLWKESDPNYRTKKYDPGDLFMNRLRSRLKLTKNF